MPPETIQEIIDSEKPRSRGERALKMLYFWAPFVTSVAILAAAWALAGAESARAIVTYALVSFFALGKFLILTGISSAKYSPFEIAILVLYMDLAIAFFLTYNLDYAYRMPYFGRRLEGLQEYGREILVERPWMRKITFLGVVLFVMFPLTGTGAVGGSLFGRLLGMRRPRILSAIALGSTIGCFAIAALADGIARALPEEVRTSLWLELSGIGLVAAMVAFLWLRSRKIERDRAARRRAQRES